MSDLDKKIAILKDNITSWPDFPKPGILFRDIFGIFSKPEILQLLRETLKVFAEKITPRIDCIAALDARGFLLGPLIALDLKVPFVPIRKRGKLPGNIVSETYALEYGTDVVEMQRDSIRPGQRVLVVDDLLATGGTMRAACKLIEKIGGKVASCLVVIELTGLKGRNQIDADVVSVVKFD